MKIIERFGALTIDKAEIDALIAKKKFIGLNRSPRSEKIIVSLTSYKPRIDDVKYTIYSLLNQSFPPDKLILWLDEDSFPQREKNLPRDLLKLKNFGLTIDWCENLRSYKKLIPALEKFPDDIIVTADDDLFYQPDWLKILYDEHLQSPDCFIAHYGYRMRIDAAGKILPLSTWQWCFTPTKTTPPLFANEAGTGGGILIKKNFLHHDALKRELFLELAPLDDELWIWAMGVLRGTKTKFPLRAMSRLIYTDIEMQAEGKTLWSKNRTQKDVQLLRLIARYPALREILIRESVTLKPYISVVLPVRNSAELNVCLKNLFRQTFPDYEIIIVNAGEHIELSSLPTNFHVVNYPGTNFIGALNLGLKKSAGEYILFKDATSILSRDALDYIAQAADSKADVIHFAGYIKGGKIIFGDALEIREHMGNFLTKIKQIRAALWLQEKLSRRLDTKIFRREFLTRQEINFGVDIAEFMFRALIDAEKYLLVPQVFSLIRE